MTDKKFLEFIGDFHTKVVKEKEILSVYKIIDQEGISRWGLSAIESNYVYVDCGRSSPGLPKGAKFEVAFASKAPKDFIEIDCEVISIQDQRGREVDVAPEYPNGIWCLLKFPEKVPDLFDQCQKYSEKTYLPRHDFLFLTSKPIMELILERWEESLTA
ncbi:MAG: hypothetical protein JNK66_07190 [Chitinophagales bacterium]|nr:hypothetical protein [Chitinophagales bacterium]